MKMSYGTWREHLFLWNGVGHEDTYQDIIHIIDNAKKEIKDRLKNSKGDKSVPMFVVGAVDKYKSSTFGESKMKKLISFLISVISISVLATGSIVTIEHKELFGDLGYPMGGVIVFKSGDFGEGGGGNRPIKTIDEDGQEDENLIHYYPREYRVNYQIASKKILAKIPLHKVRRFIMVGTNKRINTYNINQIHSFDLVFPEIVDLNNISVVNISSLTTENGDVYFAEDILSVDIEAIIEQ